MMPDLYTSLQHTWQKLNAERNQTSQMTTEMLKVLIK